VGGANCQVAAYGAEDSHQQQEEQHLQAVNMRWVNIYVVTLPLRSREAHLA
jgi:hypothetical protein